MPRSDPDSLIACDDDAPVRDVTQTVKAHRIAGSKAAPLDATIAAEVPVALVYNGESHVVMMATPADLADFALGFSLSEGILEDHRELRELGVWDGDNGIEVTVDIDDEPYRRLKDRRRNLTGRTGCGLCGVEELAQVARPLNRVGIGKRIDVTAIHKALAALRDHQAINQKTGAIHAAAWADVDGEIILAREDVGRHNALDKLIGAMTRAETNFQSGFVVITSRCSFEMVQKAVTLNMPMIVAISAPTTMALRIAERAGLTLVALARADSMTVYTNPGRITGLEKEGQP